MSMKGDQSSASSELTGVRVTQAGGATVTDKSKKELKDFLSWPASAERALEDHDDWPTRETATEVIDAARSLIQSQETQDQYIAYLATQTIDPGQMRAFVEQTRRVDNLDLGDDPDGDVEGYDGGYGEVVKKQFEPLSGGSQKVRCVDCGATGYDYDHPKSWQNAHRRGHAPCPRCGKMLALLTNGRPRGHTRCPVAPMDPAPDSRAHGGKEQ